MSVLNFPAQTPNDPASKAELGLQTINPALLYLTSLDERTAIRVRGQLDALANILQPGSDALTCPWGGITPQAASNVRATLALQFPDQRTTANLYLNVLKSVVRRAYIYGQLGLRTYEGCREELKAFKAHPVPAGRCVPLDERKRFLGSMRDDKSNAGRRDYAMFTLFDMTGARLDEVRRAKVHEIDLKTRTWTIVKGKGSRGRVIKLSAWVIPPMADWLVVRSMAPGALFVPIRHGDNLDKDLKPMSDSGIQYTHHKRRIAAGVPHFSVHDYRRTRGTEGVKAGKLKETQELLGHKDEATTLSYVRLDQSHLADYADSIADPLA